MKHATKTLLPQVREFVLRERAGGRISIPLSWIEGSVPGTRGQIQQCLSLLARDGTMFTRRKPEGVTFSYERGTVDKYFKIRISVDQAKKLLKGKYGN